MFSTFSTEEHILIQLAREVGLDPKKTSSGEYHSPCSACGGTDRFVIWPAKGKYWCRQCKKSGDAIQFCRDFMNMGFLEARDKINNSSQSIIASDKPALPPISRSWEEKALSFVNSCHQRLLIDPQALASLGHRGLQSESIRQHRLGWNPVDIYVARESWGLPQKMNDGKPKKLYLPQGIVIPAFEDGSLFKLKIRKSNWQESDVFGKYYEVPGSGSKTPIFGNLSLKVVVIVEAELDAILVIQEAGDLCCCLALAGAQKRPDPLTQQWLQRKKHLLFALDFDNAGIAEYPYWRSNYRNITPWPVPQGKSPEEAYTKYGVNLRIWISEKLNTLP